MFLKAILSTFPTLCRRPSGDLSPTVGEALNMANLLSVLANLLCHMAILGSHFLQLRAQRATEHPRYRWCGTGSALAPLWLHDARLCQHFSWPRLHATAANMDRVCSDVLSEHAQPVAHSPHALVRAGGRLASPRFASCSPVGKEVASERLRRQRGASKVRTCAHARTAWPTQALEGCSSCACCRCRSGPRWTSADRCVRA